MSQQDSSFLSRSIISVPKEWFKTFISNRGLDSLNNRPLYEYRMTDDEFETLGNIIKQQRNQSELNQILKILNLAIEKIIELKDLEHWKNPDFNTLFVFYACACWQRYYDGGSWKWDFIFNNLEFEIAPIKIYPIIEKGFKNLGIRLIENNNRTDYLGTIYANSGIPIAFLDNKKHGWLHSVLKEAYKNKIQSNKTAKQCIENNKSKITSETLRNSEHTLDLLAKIVDVLDSVQKKYSLKNQDNPFEYLQNKAKNWANNLPVPLNDEKCKTFLNNLLSETAKIVRPEQMKNPFELYRFIKNETLNISLKINGDVKTDILKKLLKNDTIKFKGGNFEIQNHEKQNIFSERITKSRKSDQEILSFDKTYIINQNYFFDELSLRLPIDAETVLMPIQKSYPISQDMPICFIYDTKNDIYEFLGTGSQKHKSDSIYVLLCNDYFKNISDISPLFSVTHQDKNFDFYKIDTKKLLLNTENDSFLIQPNTEAGTEIFQTYNGNELEYQTNYKSFIGIPDHDLYDLYIKNSENQFQKLSKELSGIHTVYMLDTDKNILFKQTLALLPCKFEIKTHYRKEYSTIEINSYGCFDSIDIPHDDSFTVTPIEARFKIIPKTETIPKTLDILLSNNKKSLKITTPFPAKGIKCFKPDGKIFNPKPDAYLFLNDLYGYCVVFYNNNSVQTIHIEMRLEDEKIDSKKRKNIYSKKEIKTDNTVTEWRLNDFKSELQELFAISDHIDSAVKLSFFIGTDEKHTDIVIKQFANQLEYDERLNLVRLTNIKDISLDDMSNTKISVLSLSALDMRFVNLIPVNEYDAIWQAPKVGNSALILYPAPESKVKFRPFVMLPNKEQTEIFDVDAINTLTKAVNIDDKDTRLKKIKTIISQMAENPNHKDWAFIKKLYDKTSHVPMVTFDVWRAFAQCPETLMALMIKDIENNTNIVIGLTQEFPILFQVMPIQLWDKIYGIWYKACQEKYQQSVNLIFSEVFVFIENKLNLSFVANYLRDKFDIVYDKQPPVAPALMQILFNQEFTGDDNRQGLIARHDTFPEDLQESIKTKYDCLPDDFKKLLPKCQHKHQISVLYLPAVMAYDNFNSTDTYSADKIFQIKKLIAFDNDWFYLVFDCLQAHLNNNFPKK